MQPDIVTPKHLPMAFGTRRTEVLIVGAGPTGLALACDLRDRGIAVTIIDKAAGPATTSRALGVQPRGTEILGRLGALGDLPARAVNPVALSVFAGRRRLMRVPIPAPSITQPNVLIIGQAEIEEQLRTRLAELGCQVMWGTELVGARDDGAGLDVSLRTGAVEHIVRADWLVGCDGAHSKVRKLAGIAFEGTSFGETFLLADVRVNWTRSHRESVAWLHADGMFAAMPLPGPDIWRLMAELPLQSDVLADQSGGSISNQAAISLLEGLLKERVDDETTRVSDPSWVSLFRFHRRLAARYRQGRLLLAGDAAHIHSPFGAQGMNTGLGDAYNLGWKLAMAIQGRAGDRLIDSYEAERRPIGAGVLKRTTRHTTLLLGKSVRSRLVRDYLFLPLMNLPVVQRKMAANGSQLNITYRHGPLARSSGLLSRLNGRWRSGPKAGDRGPNATCRLHQNGQPTTLADQTSTGWALLTFGALDEDIRACTAAVRSRLGSDLRILQIVQADAAAPTKGVEFADSVLIDSEGEIMRLYRPRETEIVILRPDGHVGWRGSPIAASRLPDWLDAGLVSRYLPCPDHRRSHAKPQSA